MTSINNDIDAITTLMGQFLESLDNEDMERLIDCCDEDILTANDTLPTIFGKQAVQNHFTGFMQRYSIESNLSIEHIKVYGDFAVAVGRFEMNRTIKATAETNSGTGRVILLCRRNDDGKWRVLVDVDNN